MNVGYEIVGVYFFVMISEVVVFVIGLCQMVDELYEQWSSGGKLECGDFVFFDFVDDWFVVCIIEQKEG